MTTYSVTIRCGLCGREDYKKFYNRDQWLPPKGWFKMWPEGDWRCGCILKQKPKED